MTCLFLSHDNKHVPFGCHAVATTDPLKSFTSFINQKTIPRGPDLNYRSRVCSFYALCVKGDTEKLDRVTTIVSKNFISIGCIFISK